MTIQENVPLAHHTTLGVGGPARWFVRVTTQPELLEAVAFAHARRMQIFVLGGGSNLLVSDQGFDGLVIHAVFGNHAVVHPPLRSVDRQDGLAIMSVTVDAGIEWDDFVFYLCKQGISGVECLAGIPGLVGGSPIQNIGAYGQEVADTIVSVTALDLNINSFVTLSRAECNFAYRNSVFNTTGRNRYIITCVDFQFDLHVRPKLTYADLTRHFAKSKSAPTPMEIYHAVRVIRARKGMLLVEGDSDVRSAGSFFKNPVVEQSVVEHIATALEIAPTEIVSWAAADEKIKLSAAWLVERAGFHKGFRMGRAGISTKHTLALVNLGGATGSEIVALRDAVIRKVEDRFAIRLEQEPVMLGFTPPD